MERCFSSEAEGRELAMYYEWNEAKARRQYLIKFATVWLAAIALAFLPVWWLVQETTF